jgi:tetratricopeptide (TPR) repeat protein
VNDRERFQRIEAIFLAAQRLPAGERLAFVTERAGDDHTLRDEALALLEEDDRSIGALDQPPLGRADLDALARQVQDSPLPERIGRYKIVGLLGVGGMGAVYEAEQEDPRRRVALKIIRPGLVTPTLLHRFRREALALAQLSHPGIARIYEAGAAETESGETPYFAMELIRGQPLGIHADAHNLGLRERLELVARVADALAHAHEQSVIHRDLKPANILVEDSGRPRILDFGVSRVAYSEDDESTLHTESGIVLGTLGYMSPEQASGDTTNIDRRSDVYSLGVIAYELLSGGMPYEVRRQALHEAARVIREREPASLSAMNRSLRGDAETIIFKALAKEPDRRYQTAGEFADDIRRFLSNEPIRARPPTASYQLRKFAKRNKPLVAGVAAAFAVLFVSLVVITGLLVRTMRAETLAKDERDAASLQAAIAEEINDFLVDDLIAAVSPENTQDRDVTLLELLDAASKSVDDWTFEHPEVEAAIRHTIARTYFELGQSEIALPNAEKAVSIALNAYGEDHDEAQSMLNTAGHIHRSLGRFDEAAPYYERVLAARRSDPDIDPGLKVVAMSNLAGLYRSMGRTPEVFSLLEEALEIAEQSLEPDANYRLSAQSTLAGAYREAGRTEEAAALYEQILATTRKKYPPGHPRLLREMNSLALVYNSMDRFDEAEALYLDVLEQQRSLLGPDNPQTLITQSNYGSMLNSANRSEESRDLLLDGLARFRATVGDDHPAALSAAFNLAKTYQSLGEYENAIALLRDNLARSTVVYGALNPRTLSIKHSLVSSRLDIQSMDGLPELSQGLIADAREALSAGHPYLGIFLVTNGEVMEASGHTQEALDCYREAAAILDGSPAGLPDRWLAEAKAALARLETQDIATGASPR